MVSDPAVAPPSKGTTLELLIVKETELLVCVLTDPALTPAPVKAPNSAASAPVFLTFLPTAIVLVPVASLSFPIATLYEDEAFALFPIAIEDVPD